MQMSVIGHLYKVIEINDTEMRIIEWFVTKVEMEKVIVKLFLIIKQNLLQTRLLVKLKD